MKTREVSFDWVGRESRRREKEGRKESRKRESEYLLEITSKSEFVKRHLSEKMGQVGERGQKVGERGDKRWREWGKGRDEDEKVLEREWRGRVEEEGEREKR